MGVKLNKIFGWIIFFIGLGIIFWVIFNSYNIFTAKTPAPDIFKVVEEKITTPTKGKTPATQEELQKEMGKAIGEQLKGILPVDTLPKLLNLVAWSIFAGILFFGGGQISGLGIKLMKS